MKSKLFTHKFFVVLCISVAALLGLSFLARATIVNNRFEQMAVDEKYSLKPSADGQFLIQFQDDKNGNFYATVGLFQGGYYGLDDAYIPTSYDENTKITAIEKEAFSEFDCLKKVVIPSGICEIKDDAFKDSKNITEIYIAPSVNKIAKPLLTALTTLRYMPKRVLMLKNLRLKIKSIIKTIRPSLKIRRLKIPIIQKSETVRITANIIIMMLSMMTASPCA